jgi:hypothetical protein
MMLTERTICIGHVAVDSGQLMICDPCYIKSSEWEEQPYNPTPNNPHGVYPFNYNGACGASLSDEMAGSLMSESGFDSAGVAFASGYGDGLYPVYATYINDPTFGMRISKIEVVMIQDEEEEDYE